jgi:hypothetical protein
LVAFVVLPFNNCAAVAAIQVKELSFFIYPNLVDVGQGFEYGGRYGMVSK